MPSPQLLEHHSCSLSKLVYLTGTWELRAEAALQSQDTKGIPPYIKETDLETKNLPSLVHSKCQSLILTIFLYPVLKLLTSWFHKT